MKTGIITCALTVLALSAGITAHAQTVSDKKAKRQKEEIVNVRVWLNKGEDKVIDGYLRSALVNRPDNIEISLTADGKRMRYVNEDVDSLLLDGSDKYVKRLVKMYGALGGPAKVEWVREEYRGKGIDLYSLFTVEAERTGRDITVVRPVRSWYLSIAGDMAIMVGSDTRNSIFDKAEPPMYGSMLNKYFGKIYDYPGICRKDTGGRIQHVHGCHPCVGIILRRHCSPRGWEAQGRAGRCPGRNRLFRRQ